MKPLTFDEFQQLNRIRCEEGFNHPVDETNIIWPWDRWALCVAGEAGELANKVKKVLRGDFTLNEKKEDLLSELADVITYADLMVSALGANTSEILMKKFDEISTRIDWQR